MTRISAIVMSLLLMIGLTAEAQAVTSGSIKCVAFQGPAGTATTIVPLLMYFNPNATGTQNITRVRVFDQTGASIADISPAPGTAQVPGRGSFPISLAGESGGIQIIVNWQQGADAAAPILRLNLLADNGVDFTSAAQSNCP